MGIQKLRKEQLTADEYHASGRPVMSRLFAGNLTQTDQFYMKDEDGFVVSVTNFSQYGVENFHERMSVLEYLKRKTDIGRVLPA